MFPRNDEQYSMLSSEFQKTVDSSFAWESAVSAYLGLTALRGFWPMTLVGSAGESNGLANDLHLTNNNIAQFTVQDGAPCVDMASGSSQYFSRADSAYFDILGTETYVDGSYRGLTFGCWYRAATLAATQALISKYDAAGNDRAYLLYVDAGGNPWVEVSANGTDQFAKEFTGNTVATGEWHFVVGRYDPSTSVDIWLNQNYESNTTTIPAALNNSGESFKIGAMNNTPSDFLDGKVSMAFLCAAYLPDAIIRRLYSRTRPLFQPRNVWQT